jgi:adenylate cyclase
MGQKEIERKWLIDNTPDLSGTARMQIRQGYIAVSDKGLEVRLRRKDGKFFQTVKTGEGLQRDEIEIELSEKQFRKLWPATRGRRLDKIRHTLKRRGQKIEVDIYRQKLSGLKVAEVEFKTRKQAQSFSPPEWFGKEVTRDKAYKNANLAGRSGKKE